MFMIIVVIIVIAIRLIEIEVAIERFENDNDKENGTDDWNESLFHAMLHYILLRNVRCWTLTFTLATYVAFLLRETWAGLSFLITSWETSLMA